MGLCSPKRNIGGLMGEADYVHSFALVPVFQALGGLTVDGD